MTLFLRLVFAGGLMLAAAFFSGCASTENDPIFTTASGETNQVPLVARFQVGDTVTVNLSGMVETIEPHIEAIKEDGTITMPDIGHVQAAGKTAGELQNTIHDLYVPKFYTHITVAVTAGDRVYYVNGEVKNPGRQLYLGETTLTQAITSAGDFTDFANHGNVWLIRGHHKLKVDCDEIFSHPEKDLIIYPGDEIDVRRRIF
jgi:protein involved in polysaccharide export with SLBB domain